MAARAGRGTAGRGNGGAKSGPGGGVSILSYIRSVRSILAVGLAVRALAWGALAALTMIIGTAIADMMTPLGVTVRAALLGLASVAGVATAAAFAWRDRRVFSLERVALWIEERFPSLEFTVVTAA